MKDVSWDLPEGRYCDICDSPANFDTSPEGQNCSKCGAWVCDACTTHEEVVICKGCVAAPQRGRRYIGYTCREVHSDETGTNTVNRAGVVSIDPHHSGYTLLRHRKLAGPTRDSLWWTADGRLIKDGYGGDDPYGQIREHGEKQMPSLLAKLRREFPNCDFFEFSTAAEFRESSLERWRK